MNISSIRHHEGFQKYVRPTLIVTGIILAVATVALAVLLVAPGLVPAIAFQAKLALASGSAFLAVLFLGVSLPNSAPPAPLPVYRAEVTPLLIDGVLLSQVYKALSAFIYENRFTSVGVFRESGNKRLVDNFINNLDHSLDISDLSVHDACAALKQLAQRTQSTLTLKQSDLNLEAAIEAFYALTPAKRVLVWQALLLLHSLEDYDYLTQMNVHNLAISANSLLITSDSRDPRPVIKLAEEMINNFTKFNKYRR